MVIEYALTELKYIIFCKISLIMKKVSIKTNNANINYITFKYKNRYQ